MNKKSLILIISIIIMIILSCIYYHNYNNSNILETIYYDSTPWKVRAENKGGLIITNASNSLYETINHNDQSMLKKIAIRPDPEKPIQIFELKNSTNDPFQNLVTEEIETIIENNDLDIIISNKLQDKIEDTNKILEKSTYKLQLASYRSEKDAINELNKIKQRTIKILDQSSLKIVQKKYQNTIFYNIISGDYPIFKAKILCKKLTNAQQECVLY